MTAQASIPSHPQLPSPPDSLRRAVKRAKSAGRDLDRELAKYAEQLAAAGIELETDDQDHSSQSTGEYA